MKDVDGNTLELQYNTSIEDGMSNFLLFYTKQIEGSNHYSIQSVACSRADSLLDIYKRIGWVEKIRTVKIKNYKKRKIDNK